VGFAEPPGELLLLLAQRAGTTGTAEKDHRADREEGRGDELDRALRQQGQQPPGGDRHDALDEECGDDADPDRKVLVAGGEYQSGYERFVR
jgi:hypothetical protein